MTRKETPHPSLILLANLAEDLVASLGPGFEIVVHDFRNPKSSVIGVAGDVTGRGLGAPLTDLVLRLLKSNRTEKNLLNYQTTLGNGKLLRSSTLFVHDETGKAIGCLCINQDITSWNYVRSLVSAVCKTEELDRQDTQHVETFASDIKELLRTSIRAAIEQVGKPVALMDREDKINIVHSLNEQGTFQIRGALAYLAKELGVSRYTVYNYLNRDSPS